jgi:hypothetical protein
MVNSVGPNTFANGPAGAYKGMGRMTQKTNPKDASIHASTNRCGGDNIAGVRSDTESAGTGSTGMALRKLVSVLRMRNVTSSHCQ